MPKALFMHAKSQLGISHFFWDIAKTLQSCYFGKFGNTWPSPSKIILSIFRKLSWLSACKNSPSSLTSFLRYCKEIANLLFYVLWACLASHTQSGTINLYKNLVFIRKQKINFIPHVFLEIFQRCCKLVILGTLSMPGYAHPKW